MTSTAYTTTSTNEPTTRTKASVTGGSQTTTLSTVTTGGQDMTSTAYTTTSTNEQTTRSGTSSSNVSQTTTISTTTGGQDMTSTVYTTTSTNEQTTRTEASVTGATTGGLDMTSTAYTTTSTNEQTTRSGASSSYAMCPCQCEYFDKIEYWAQENNQLKQFEELSQKLAEIKSILKMETKNLSSFVNKKISADDDRPSAVATGYLGAGIIIIVVAGIVLLDLPVIIQQARFLFRDIKRMCVRAQ
nr:endochitinase 2 isoform X2 [Crassostrea gigas]